MIDEHTVPEDWIADTTDTEYGPVHARLRCPECDTEPYFHPFGDDFEQNVRAYCPECDDATWVSSRKFTHD